MVTSLTESSIDVAYWFIYQAEEDGVYLEDEKLQNLLFLAQVHYALAYNMEMLMPSMFVCDESGFKEPTLNKIFAQGHPFMPKAALTVKANDFLLEIWKKYSSLSMKELANVVKNNPAYKENYVEGVKNVVQLNLVVEKFISNSNILKDNNAYSDNKKKILLSQNGPVVVSKWQPRKVARSNSKGG